MNAAEPSNKSDALITPLPWASRTSGMPYLPGGGDKQVQILKILFQAIEEADGYDKTTVDLGDGISRTLQEATKQVTPAGLVTRLNREQVAVSPESQRWLQSGKIEDLFAVLHKHVRYVGEFLRELEVSPLSTRDLNNLAAEKYDLQWNTLDQIRRRTSWLLSMGLIERRTSKLLGITEKGKACVELLGEDEIAYPAPEPTRTDESAELSEPPAPIRQLIDSLDEKKLRERKSAIGYIPRGNREFDATEALLNLVNACSPRITRIELRSHAMTTFGVSESSFAASLTTLTSAGLIEETSLNVFAPTDAGAAWLETGKAEDLVLIFHSKFLFVLEILPLLSEFDKAPGLARAAAEHFGMSRPDVGGVRLRLQLLKAAGLVYERANWRFRATALGHAFAETYPLQKITNDEDTEALGSFSRSDSSFPSEEKNTVTALTVELQEAATAANTPVRLEIAVAEAFNFLGFEATHLGGGGNTDILAAVEGPEGENIRIAIDAKTAGSGTVAENAISFDTLNEHKKKHDASLSVLVGANFDAGRIRKRAEQHGIRLLTVEELSRTLLRHAQIPLSAASYLDLVSVDDAQRQNSENQWSNAKRRLELLSHIVSVLSDESNQRDEITGGALSSDQIYLIVRAEMDPRPSAYDIEESIKLLEHPLMGSVVRGKSSARSAVYRLRDRPSLVAAKLRTISDAIQLTDSE